MKAKEQNLACVILAAGKGTRMRSNLPKVMHKIAGKPMLFNVVDTTLVCNAKRIIVVTSPEMESVRTALKSRYGSKVQNVIQKKQLGTADAVKAAKGVLGSFKGNVAVLYGDTPLIEQKTISSLLTALSHSWHTALVVLGMEMSSPNSYGRLILDRNGNVERIVEEREATAKEKAITLCNSGVMAVRASLLFKLLARVSNKNSKGEYYLTDLVELAREDGYKCELVVAKSQELVGINSRMELAVAESIVQNKLRRKMMENGTTLVDPSSIYFAHDTKIGKDVVVHPHVVFGENVRVDDNVEIRSFSHIEGAKIAKDAVIGPFARIRPGTYVGESAHVGNFVELKKTRLGKGAKVNHLSYVGDTNVGEKTNIGAGTITCNYDGFKKHVTEIGAGAFIGSNTSLVAPVKIGDGAIVAAGSVVTDNVSRNSLVIARSEQEEKPDWAKEFREKQ